MDDEALWKRRFLVFALVRLAGLATIFFGVAIAYSSLLREGGWPAVGLIVAIMGLIDAVFAPRLLKKQWEREDRGE
jgi:membrane protein implicated in regulation of membrane protease activity